MILLFHNLMAAYYAYAMFHYYLSLSLKNMHSVEDTMISALYQRAESIGVLLPGDMRIFYYTRKSFIRNWCEMMGTRNFMRWVVPIPYFGRQNHDFQSNDPCDLDKIEYMKLDRLASKSLVTLEYRVETLIS